MISISILVLIWITYLAASTSQSQTANNNRCDLRVILALQEQTWKELGSEIIDAADHYELYQESKIIWQHLNTTFCAYLEESEAFLERPLYDTRKSFRPRCCPKCLESSYYATHESNHLSTVLSEFTANLGRRLLPASLQTKVARSAEWSSFLYTEEMARILREEITQPHRWGQLFKFENMFGRSRELREALGHSLIASRQQEHKTATIMLKMDTTLVAFTSALEYHRAFAGQALRSMAVWDDMEDRTVASAFVGIQWELGSAVDQCRRTFGGIADIVMESPDLVERNARAGR